MIDDEPTTDPNVQPLPASSRQPAREPVPPQKHWLVEHWQIIAGVLGIVAAVFVAWADLRERIARIDERLNNHLEWHRSSVGGISPEEFLEDDTSDSTPAIDGGVAARDAGTTAAPDAGLRALRREIEAIRAAPEAQAYDALRDSLGQITTGMNDGYAAMAQVSFLEPLLGSVRTDEEIRIHATLALTEDNAVSRILVTMAYFRGMERALREVTPHFEERCAGGDTDACDITRRLSEVPSFYMACLARGRAALYCSQADRLADEIQRLQTEGLDPETVATIREAYARTAE